MFKSTDEIASLLRKVLVPYISLSRAVDIQTLLLLFPIAPLRPLPIPLSSLHLQHCLSVCLFFFAQVHLSCRWLSVYTLSEMSLSSRESGALRDSLC